MPNINSTVSRFVNYSSVVVLAVALLAGAALFLSPNDQIVSYCHIGQQATVVYFVAKYLGFDARLYDGSFEDWSRRSELPVIGPPAGPNK